MTLPKLFAAVPLWDEDAETVKRCIDSLEDVCDGFTYPGAVANFLERIGGDVATAQYATSTEMRQYGLDRAAEAGADWCLQIDADERLVNGHLLAPILAGGRYAAAYPLPRLEEDGTWSVCAFKCVRVPAKLVASCDHFDIGGKTYLLSGYPSPPEELASALRGLPHLVHEPSKRRPIRPVRLGAVEDLERIEGTPLLPLPPYTLSGAGASVGAHVQPKEETP